MAIEFWLSYNNGAEKLRLPVNPASIKIKTAFSYSDITITHFGEYTVIGERGAAEISFESFFPREYNASYCEYADFPAPSECVRTIERWRDTRKPIRLVVTGTDINYAATVRDFPIEVQRAGSPGDIYYSLSLKEYRFLDVSAQPKDVKKPVKVAAKQRPPVVNKGDTKSTQPYIVKAGDSLSKVFGKNWPKVYAANKKVIGNNPNVIKSGMKLVIPK